MPDLVGKKTLKVKNWAKADTKALANYLGGKKWSLILNETEAETAWNLFKNNISEAVKRYVPLSTARSPTDPKWLTREIVKLARKKALLENIHVTL